MKKTTFKKIMNKNSYINLLSFASEYKLKLFIITISNIIVSLVSISIALSTKRLIDSAISSDTNTAFIFGIITAILFLFQIAIRAFLSINSAKLKELMRNNIQHKFIYQIYRKKWFELNKYKSGDLLTRITNDTRNIVDIIVTVFPNVISLCIQLLVAFIILSRYDRLLSLFAFIIGPISIIVSWYIGKKLKTVQSKIQFTESKLRSFITEAIQNLILIKSFEYERESLRAINETQEVKKNLIIKKSKISALSNAITQIGFSLGFFGAIALGAFRLYTSSITFGTFTAFLQLVGQVQSPLHQIARTIPKIIATLASVERIDEINELDNEDNNNKNSSFLDKITLESISFSYDKEDPILDDLSLEIKRGEKIALVGLSGEGKTTIIRLLLSLIKPTSGKINVSVNTRKYFSYVPQQNILFSGSIRENLKFSKNSLDNKKLDYALNTACANEFINKLPNGLDTIIGERGIGLSQGQIQRICIARALLRETSFLILDEATASLDTETEIKVIDKLKRNYNDLSIIAITHRKPILDISDSIYTLKNGILEKETFNKKPNKAKNTKDNIS